MELIKVGLKTYYIKNNTNIGVYEINDNFVYLIDTGNDKEAGKKVLKIIEENGWKVKGIINTHSNADHIGGNKYIQDKTSCSILASKSEKAFIENPALEPSFLYGAYPFKELKNKFLLAKESVVTDIDNNLPEELDYFSIKGHFIDMIGIKTSDNVYFLGDSLFSEETINKYHIFYIYDVKEYLNTLSFLNTLEGYFIPSHANATDNIKKIIEMNKQAVNDIADTIYTFCLSATFEKIMQKVFKEYHLEMNSTQYVLIGSTIKSYLSYLYENEKITYEFLNNKMIWKQKEIK